jgi:protoporphyrin/coproporphyrin ferrochelatase
MTTYTGTADYRHDQDDCTGILLVNLGTTEAPTAAAVRRYLAEFLWDPRVIEIPRPLWWLILHGVILRFRPAKVAHAYQAIWTERGSPLLANCIALAETLQAAVGDQFNHRVEVELAMRYGQPSIERALTTLRERGMRRLLVVPMYPQYSATTTGSVFDEVASVLQGWRWVPGLRMIQNYHDHPLYIKGLADSVRSHWANQGQAEKLMMSFHGIPKRYFISGDPYFCECHKTARLLAAELGLDESQWLLTFQSRVGREEWLKPYTDKTLETLGHDKLQSVDVICPGFSIDCLETLEEIDMQNRELFESAGGGRYSYIPALNDSPAHTALLMDLVNTHMQGWEGSTAGLEQRQATQRRAQAMGADH